MRLSVLLSVALLMFCACDSDTQARRAARADLEAVEAEFHKVAVLFAPFDEAKTASKTVQELAPYVQGELPGLIKMLAPKTKSGSKAQQISAHRLLTDAKAASARYKSRRAVANWIEMEGEQATLLGDLLKLNRAEARSRLSGPDETPVLNRLKDDKSNRDHTFSELRKAHQKLAQRIGETTSQIASHSQRRDDLGAEAAEINQKAFALDGQEKFELENEAGELMRQSDVQDAAVQRQSVLLEGYRSELAIVNQQVQLLSTVLEVTNDHIKHVDQRQLTRQKRIAEADSTKQKILDEWTDRFQNLDKRFDTTAAVLLGQALFEMDEALTQLKDAKDKAVGDRVTISALDIEILSKRVEKAQILSNQVVIAGAYGRGLAVLYGHSGAMMSQNTESLGIGYEEARNAQAKATQEGLSLIQLARDQAAGLLNSPEHKELAEKLDEQLQYYRQRINEAVLPERPQPPAPR